MSDRGRPAHARAPLASSSRGTWAPSRATGRRAGALAIGLLVTLTAFAVVGRRPMDGEAPACAARRPCQVVGTHNELPPRAFRGRLIAASRTSTPTWPTRGRPTLGKRAARAPVVRQCRSSTSSPIPTGSCGADRHKGFKVFHMRADRRRSPTARCSSAASASSGAGPTRTPGISRCSMLVQPDDDITLARAAESDCRSPPTSLDALDAEIRSVMRPRDLDHARSGAGQARECRSRGQGRRLAHAGERRGKFVFLLDQRDTCAAAPRRALEHRAMFPASTPGQPRRRVRGVPGSSRSGSGGDPATSCGSRLPRVARVADSPVTTPTSASTCPTRPRCRERSADREHRLPGSR